MNYISVKEAAAQWDVPFTGVFAANDLMAMGAMKRFWEAGLRIPEDISICGCDDILAASYTAPPLATLQSHAVTLGEYLMYQLLEKMQPGRSNPLTDKQIHAEFVAREYGTCPQGVNCENWNGRSDSVGEKSCKKNRRRYPVATCRRSGSGGFAARKVAV